MSAPAARRLALSIWGVALVFTAAGLLLLFPNRSTLGGASFIVVPTIFLPGLAYSTLGALIAVRHPRNPVGWILAVLGLNYAIAFFGLEYAILGLHTAPGSLPAATFVAWLQFWPLYLALDGGLPLFFLLFPNGRLLSGRWKVVAWLALTVAGLQAIVAILTPGPILGTNLGEGHRFNLAMNPTGVNDWRALLLTSAAALQLALPVIGIASLSALVLRFIRSRGEERQQLKWLAYAGAVLVVSITPVFSGTGLVSAVGWSLLTLALDIGLPGAAAVAILKYRLYDIDPIINKSVVFAALAAFITAVYVGIVVGIGNLIGSAGQPNLTLSILATAVVAVAFQPVRDRVQRFANRLVYGKRATPYEVLSQFSDRVGSVYSSEEVLPRMATVLGEATGASRADVWIRLDDQIVPAAAWPAVDGPTPSPVSIAGQGFPPVSGVSRIVPVRHQGELLGALSINKRPGEGLTPVEENLLTDLAAQAGLVIRNVRLTVELQARLRESSARAAELRAARQRLVAAGNVARSQLERNIQAATEPRLLSIAGRIAGARQLVQRDAAGAATVLGQLTDEANEILELLRDLARGIYPPLLIDKGAVAALQAYLKKARVPVQLDTDREFATNRFDEQVEGAVYFCCVEALQNVAQHAGAAPTVVWLSATDGRATFSITDSGPGFEQQHGEPGPGLQTMTDRVRALGGSLEVRSARGAGTTVEGWIPARALEPIA
ncbi:MAG TPA: ATP-binding protein [Candidatus Dormibacteraeota bacterium]|nr:ATP-binding protein [Candidatus Dormibacteraeota bacterium]